MPIFNPSSSGSGAMTLLSDTTLAVAGRFDIQNISQDYTDLYIVATNLRSTVAAATDNCLIYFNNDTTATNYRGVWHRYTDAAHSTSVGDTPLTALVTGASATASYVGHIEVMIREYASSAFKICHTLGYERSGASDISGWDFVIHWESSSAINRFTFQPDGYATDTFDVGAHLRIWGVS